MACVPKCPGCGRRAIARPLTVCNVCHREVATKKFGSRAKGNAFELQVAKAFSEWWGEEKSFRRTPLSGAWDKRAGGDLVTPDGFPFTVECKAFEDWELTNLITSDKSLLEQHWGQAVSETADGKRPLLVFTKNHYPAFYMMTGADWKNLGSFSDEGRVMVLTDCEDDLRIIGLFSDLLKNWRCPRRMAVN